MTLAFRLAFLALERVHATGLPASLLDGHLDKRPGISVTNDPGFYREVRTLALYRRFYHRKPAPEQVTRLLGEPGVAPR